MSKTVLILFAACVGLSLLSLHLVKQMRAGQATIAKLQEQVATLERQRQNSSPLPSEVEAPIPTFQPEQNLSTPATRSEAASKETLKGASPLESSLAALRDNNGGPSREDRIRMLREHHERQRQLMQDPEYREALLVQYRSHMSRQYPGLAQELGLTTEQTEQLFNLLADQQMSSNARIEPMWDIEGADATDVQQRREKAQQQWAERQRNNEAELAAHLGQEKMQAWKDYQSTLGARHQAQQLRDSLATQGVPLNEDANRAVVKALVEAQKAEIQEYANQPRTPAASQAKAAVILAQHGGATPELFEQHMERTKKRNQRVLDALSPYITHEQREAVEKDHEAQLKMQEAQLRLMRAQGNAGANTGFVSSDGVLTVVPQ